MRDDFIRELGYLALASRLKRISDRMVQSGKQMYKSLDIEVEPNWYLVFKILQKHQALSVTEIAQYLQFSHPSVITLVNKMTKKGYVKAVPSQYDGRKTLIHLTEKGQEALPELEKIWQAGEDGIAEMLGNNGFLEMLEKVENALDQQNFMERTLKKLNQK